MIGQYLSNTNESATVLLILQKKKELTKASVAPYPFLPLRAASVVGSTWWCLASLVCSGNVGFHVSRFFLLI